MLATSAGLEIRLNGQTRFDVLAPPAFAFRFGGFAPEGSGFRLAGLSFAVKDLEDTERFLRAGGVEVKNHAGRLLAEPCEGVAVAFETV